MESNKISIDDDDALFEYICSLFVTSFKTSLRNDVLFALA